VVQPSGQRSDVVGLSKQGGVGVACDMERRGEAGRVWAVLMGKRGGRVVLVIAMMVVVVVIVSLSRSLSCLCAIGEVAGICRMGPSVRDEWGDASEFWFCKTAREGRPITR
jgi:hypothetical protein